MKLTKIIPHAKMTKMFEDEEKGLYDLTWIKQTEFEDLLYSVYEDKKTGKRYAVNIPRTIHMGFNSNEDGKEEKFIAIMEKEGRCKASWGVTGRTAHEILGFQLAKKYPQFKWSIGGYDCTAENEHRMVLQPGFEPEVQM